MTVTVKARRLDGLRRIPLRQHAPLKKAVARKVGTAAVEIQYPDFTTWLEPVTTPLPNIAKPKSKVTPNTVVAPSAPIVATPPVAVKTARAVALRPVLRTIRHSVVRSGFSWFLVMAVVSASAVGVFALTQQGLATKSSLEQQASAAQNQLEAGARALQSQDVAAATSAFGLAAKSFDEIQKEISDIDGSLRVIAELLPNQPLESAEHLSKIGIHLSNAGTKFAEALDAFGNVDPRGLAPPELQSAAAISTDPTTSAKTLTDALVIADPSFSTALSEIDAALSELQLVSVEQLPQQIKDVVVPLKEQIPSLQQDVRLLQGLFGVLAQIAGATSAKTYLITLQNPNELRPTGGFMGQFAILKIQHGVVEKLAIKSIYDADGQVRTKTEAPEGLDVISENFSLRDANWSPDFASSANVLLDFFQETGDPRFDGVVALTPALVTQILAVTGPITVADLETPITEDNFIDEAQYEVAEKNLEREKSFFPNFSQSLFERLFALESPAWPQVLQAVTAGVMHKDLQVYFVDQAHQQFSQNVAGAGQLPQGPGDRLSVVAANIGGGKTDSFIKESRELNIILGEDTVRHELTITRSDTRDVQFKDRDNRHYLRFYVPEGAHLVSAEGFDRDYKELLAYPCSDCKTSEASPAQWEADSNTRITQELGSTVFANWLTLKAGEEKRIRVVYDVPRNQMLSSNGALTISLWRQPGSSDIPTDISIQSVTASERVVHVTDGQVSNGKGIARVVLDRDRVIGALFE